MKRAALLRHLRRNGCHLRRKGASFSLDFRSSVTRLAQKAAHAEKLARFQP